MDNLFVVELLAGASIIGAVAFLLAMRDSRDFDRRYGEASVSVVGRDGAKPPSR